VVICLERDADLHMAQRIPLPLTVSCFSEIQIGFTFLVPAHLSSPGQRAVKWVCVYSYNHICVLVTYIRVSVLLWRRCDMLCTFGIIRDYWHMCSRNGFYASTSIPSGAPAAWRWLRPVLEDVAKTASMSASCRGCRVGVCYFPLPC